jgi:hypothetical protein
MRKLVLIVAAAASLTAVPAFAGAPDVSEPAIKLAQLDVCVGPDCRERGRDYRFREGRRFDRDYAYERDWRFRRSDRDCRDVTVRERRGDEVIVRQRRRCD